MIEFFNIYTNKLKWKVTPIAVNSKNPVLEEWNKKYNKEKIRQYISENDCNLGLCLGDIVDVEADTKKANQLLEQLIGSYRHPRYKSCRSVHHLFQSPDPKLRKIIIQGIEFRGHSHQSLLPPSSINGREYKWLSAELPIPPVMPDRLLKFYWQYVKRIVRPSRKCNQCKEIYHVNNKRYNLEQQAFKSLGTAGWLCLRCRRQFTDIRNRCRQLRLK